MFARPNVRSWLSVAALPFVLAWPGQLAAQYTEVPPPDAYALRGVTVVQADGRRNEGVTIVVRGHFIETLATGAALPADARILEGDSLVVYPGFVDAQGTAKFEFPKVEIDRSQVPSWDPPREAQGFMPHRRVVDYLEATGADLADRRKQGIVAAAVHPDGPLMPGRGAFLLFRRDAARSAELVHTPVLGPVMTLSGGTGYPGTLFGVQAFYRQTLEDARRNQLIANEYARDPRQLTPPHHDPEMEVVQEIMGGKVPVYFMVNSAADIRRVLDLSDQYGLHPVIVGGAEAWQVADRLKARDVPVLVSLDFPAAQHWKPEEARSESEPLDAAELREKKRLEEIYANPAKLAAAGVRFALTSGGGKADLREGARKVIEYGLSEAAALRAITATPAELFGVARAARIEAGLPATFVVTDGPLFGKETRIVYTFVEGALEPGREARKPGANDSKSDAVEIDLTGTWSAEISADIGSTTGSMSLKQTGGSFTGSISDTEVGVMTIQKGNITGNQIGFQLIVQFGDDLMEIPFRGSVEGDTITARGSSTMGQVSLHARRSGGSGGAR